MKLLLLVNPTASAVTDRTRALVEDILAPEHDLTVTVTGHRGHATELAREAVAQGVEAVLVLAGDGTLNEAANGLAGSSTALGALPGGSTSVFARTIGFTNDLRQAAREMVAALDQGSRRRVEMGTVNGRRFLFHLGIGYDADVVAKVETMGKLKRHLGQGAFVYAAVATWFGQADRSTPRFSVTVPGEPTVHEGSFALCLNTNPYTFLGRRPLNVAPEAGHGRALAVAVVHDLRLGTIGRAFRSALGDGTDLGRQPGVTLLTGVEGAAISSAEPFAHQVDGDYLGRVDKIDVGLEPSCLDLVVPPPP